MEDRQLTKNFKLSELLHSDTADKNGYTEQYEPTQDVVDNLTELTVRILQPLRDLYGKPITVNCAYRCTRTNKAVGGVSTSQHQLGQAADITAGSREENKILYDTIRDNLVYDQLINEDDYSWVHVSYSLKHNRNMAFAL